MMSTSPLGSTTRLASFREKSLAGPPAWRAVPGEPGARATGLAFATGWLFKNPRACAWGSPAPAASFGTDHTTAACLRVRYFFAAVRMSSLVTASTRSR